MKRDLSDLTPALTERRQRRQAALDQLPALAAETLSQAERRHLEGGVTPANLMALMAEMIERHPQHGDAIQTYCDWWNL